MKGSRRYRCCCVKYRFGGKGGVFVRVGRAEGSIFSFLGFFFEM